MNVEGPVVYGIIFVAIGLGLGIAARLGVWRGFEPTYRNPELPLAYRNLPFALIPAGLAFASALVAGLVELPPSMRLASLLLYTMFPAWLLVTFFVASRPPRIFKPKWVQDEEKLARPIRPQGDWFDRVVFVGTIGLGIFTFLAVVVLLVTQL